MSSDKLSRLLVGLKTVGVETGERNKTVADKTGYALGTITRILSGNAALTDRFIQAVCSAFDLRKEWICEGKEPINRGLADYASDILKKRTLAFKDFIIDPKDATARLNKMISDGEKENKKIEQMLSAGAGEYQNLVFEFMKLPLEKMDYAIKVLTRIQFKMEDEAHTKEVLERNSIEELEYDFKLPSGNSIKLTNIIKERMKPVKNRSK